MLRFHDEEHRKPDEKLSLPAQAVAAFDYHVDRWAAIKERADACMQCLSKDGPWPSAERTARATPGQERPCIHEDVLTQYVNQVINEAQGNPIGVKVSPDGDGATDQTAEFAEKRIRHIDYESNAVQARIAGLESAVMQGVGIWEVSTEWEKPPVGGIDSMKDLSLLFRQKIVTIAAVDPWNYVLDSDSIKPDWSDQNEAFKLSRFKHEEFRQKFKNAKFTDFKGLISTDNSRWIDDDSVQVAEWWRREKTYKTVLRLDDGTPMGIAILEDQLPEEIRKSAKIIDQRKVEICTVMKRLTNGVEILDEMEWPDYEIPLLVTTGRVKYENGKRIIDSLIYAAIPGQLLHDFTVSAIQEETNRAIKTKAWGVEGSFETSTNWAMLHREPTAFAEWALVYDKNGNVVPGPELISVAPNLAALLEAKQSNMVDIQNMLGMSSTERMDRTAKSGKALESLEDNRRVSTYHFTNSWKMATEREGRIKERLLAKIDPKQGKVSLRNAKGDHEMADIPEGIYEGRHTVVISAGKAYQSQQEEVKDVFQNLMKSGDPNIQMAAMPNLVRMMDLGPMGEELAVELEAVQPPQMQQARMAVKKGQQDPKQAAQVAMMAQQQLAQMKGILQQMQQQIQQLTQEKQAKVVETNARKDIEIGKAAFQKDVEIAKLRLDKYTADMDYRIALAKINAQASADEDVLENERLLAAESQAFDFDLNQLQHLQGKEVLDRTQEHALNMSQMDQEHQASMQDTQLSAAQQQSQEAAAQQTE